MKDEDKILKIEQVLYQVASVFENAPERGITRQEYIKKHNIKTGLNFSFSLSADDIVKNKIPGKVVGCTGVAKVFCNFAASVGLDCWVISTARYSDWIAAGEADKNHTKRNIINGHQIIGVEFQDGLRAFDPGRRKLVFIDGNLRIGSRIKAIGDTGPDYLICAISSPDTFAMVTQYQHIANLYTSGDLNNSEFLIKPL